MQAAVAFCRRNQILGKKTINKKEEQVSAYAHAPQNPEKVITIMDLRALMLRNTVHPGKNGKGRPDTGKASGINIWLTRFPQRLLDIPRKSRYT